MLLTGEPGVGKTRLARAGTERAAGAMVSWGACRESEGAPPLWPWMQVLRHLGGPGIASGAAEGAAAPGEETMTDRKIEIVQGYRGTEDTARTADLLSAG